MKKKRLRTLPQWLFFLFIRPIFPLLQWFGHVSGLFVHAKTIEPPYNRQPFLIGRLSNTKSLDELISHLKQAGFFFERLAYKDPGQVLSMRRLCDTYNDRQFHIRIFSDGEVRGHYEYTPEDHPIAHMQEALFEPHTEQFRKWLSPFLAP